MFHLGTDQILSSCSTSYLFNTHLSNLATSFRAGLSGVLVFRRTLIKNFCAFVGMQAVNEIITEKLKS